MASSWPSFPESGIVRLVPYLQPNVVPPDSAIPDQLYVRLLSVRYPITVAVIYAVTVVGLNKYNARRQHKPWAFSRTAIFKYLVLLHNMLLAIYSAWTCIGMVRAVRTSFPGWSHGLPGVIDALCQIHGPPGFGNATIFSPESNRWKLGIEVVGQPNGTEKGRIWNEGLAYYGWLFYVSKFYEVVDTAIILAKGKKSSLLQTYHHTGAMLCMWAGIRFMAAPIWMFVLVNSFIHTLMYTYYNCAALSIPVPKAVKQTLTTLQIVQFIVGSVYAGLHLFISYSFPKSGRNKNAKLATTFESTPCVTNSGQAFAIWLNILYLAPLTWLFVQFFIGAYFGQQRTNGPSRRAGKDPNGYGGTKKAA